MIQNKPISSARVFTTPKSLFLKALFLSVAMWAFSSASATTTESCYKVDNFVLLEPVTISHNSMAGGEFVECTGKVQKFSPTRIEQVSYQLYKGENARITPTGPGWKEGDFNDAYAYKCDLGSREPTQCEFIVEENAGGTSLISNAGYTNAGQTFSDRIIN